MTKRNPLVGKHTLIMAAMTKALSDGRMKDFQNDMTETTRDAILDAATKNLNRLMGGKSLPKSVKSSKTEKTEKVSKKAAKPAKAEKAAKSTKTEKSVKGGNEKRLAKFEKIVLGMADAVSRIREKSDDADQIKKGVRRQFKNAGAEARSVTRNGSATVEFDGQEYRVRFQSKGPTVRHLGAAE